LSWRRAAAGNLTLREQPHARGAGVAGGRDR
jgi:hypothetical protein